jgi:hypothetical protein
VHDIADLERRGVAGVYVASSEFVDAGNAQMSSLGVDLEAVYVPHPIQDRTDDEVRALADGALEEIMAAITSDTGVPGGDETSG